MSFSDSFWYVVTGDVHRNLYWHATNPPENIRTLERGDCIVGYGMPARLCFAGAEQVRINHDKEGKEELYILTGGPTEKIGCYAFVPVSCLSIPMPSAEELDTLWLIKGVDEEKKTARLLQVGTRKSKTVNLLHLCTGIDVPYSDVKSLPQSTVIREHAPDRYSILRAAER